MNQRPLDPESAEAIRRRCLIVPADAVEKALNGAERLTAIEVKIRAELDAGAALEQVLAKYGHV